MQHPVAQKLGALTVQLQKYFQERDDVIEACLLAVLSGHHVFVLGPPGVAKTQLIRSMVKTFVGARYFEVALSRNRPAEAVTGPLDIKHFRETGEYVFRRKGYATDCEFVLFNEIGKMSDELGHDLLALLNERVYHEVRIDPATGEERSVWPAPLSTAFCDSNEMLTEGSDDAAAAWDRLGVRVITDHVHSDSAFSRVLTAGQPEIDVEIDWAELQDVILKVVPAVTIGDEVIQAMVKLRRDLEKEGVNVSTRRYRWSMDILRAAAFLADRDEVTTDDIVALRYVLWDTLDQVEKVDRICRSASNPFVGPLIKIRNQIHELQEEVERKRRAFVDAGGNDWNGPEGSALQMYAKECDKKLISTREELDTLLMEAAGRPIPGFKKISDLHHQFVIQVLMDALDQPREEAKIMAGKPKRAGQGDGGNVE